MSDLAGMRRLSWVETLVPVRYDHASEDRRSVYVVSSCICGVPMSRCVNISLFIAFSFLLALSDDEDNDDDGRYEEPGMCCGQS